MWLSPKMYFNISVYSFEDWELCTELSSADYSEKQTNHEALST